MDERYVLGAPRSWAWFFVIAWVAAMSIGSVYDWQIAISFTSVTPWVQVLTNWGNMTYFLATALAGVCVGVAFSLWGKYWRRLGRALTMISLVIAIVHADAHLGTQLRDVWGYYQVDGQHGRQLLMVYATWLVIFGFWQWCWWKFLDPYKSVKLLVLAATIIIGDLLTLALVDLLKYLASRPRPDYLLTLNDPESMFRYWWQWRPFAAMTGKQLLSWPSGHAVAGTFVMLLPTLIDVVRLRVQWLRGLLFVLAWVFLAAFASTRLILQRHFLTDVVAGVLITYLSFVLIEYLFSMALEWEDSASLQICKLCPDFRIR